MNSEFNKPPTASQKLPFCPPLITSLKNPQEGKSPFNAFVTNELSPLTQTGNNPKSMYSRPIKKFSFSEQIHDFVLQEPGSAQFPKEKDNLESFLNEDNGYSPLLGITKLNRHPSLSFAIEENNTLNELVNNKNSNIIEHMLDPIVPSSALESLKKGLINYVPNPESELNYKTPTFCHGTSTNSDEQYSYKSPKFAGTPQNSFHIDSTPQRNLPKSENSSIERGDHEGDRHDVIEFNGCNCKKSKCLKLYCECFANEKFCVKSCNCSDCKNNVGNQDLRAKARTNILIKNPNAFASKVLVRKNASPQRSAEQKTLFTKRGCNCKKSNCRKKYCECYGVGLKCSDVCKCEDCKNRENSPPNRKPITSQNNNKREVADEIHEPPKGNKENSQNQPETQKKTKRGREEILVDEKKGKNTKKSALDDNFESKSKKKKKRN